MWTHARQACPTLTLCRGPPLPKQPTKTNKTDVVESILGDGCVVGEGSKIVKSVVGLRSRIREVRRGWVFGFECVWSVRCWRWGLAGRG